MLDSCPQNSFLKKPVSGEFECYARCERPVVHLYSYCLHLEHLLDHYESLAEKVCTCLYIIELSDSLVHAPQHLKDMKDKKSVKIKLKEKASVLMNMAEENYISYKL